jgi:hypothetical protein
VAPIETGLSLIFDALSNRTRRQIILILSRNESSGFVQIMKKSGLDPECDTGSFSYHLSKLRAWGLIERTGGGYSLTLFGKKAAGILEGDVSNTQPLYRKGGHGVEITEMDEEEFSELTEAIFERMDDSKRKDREELGKALSVASDYSQWVEGWKKNRKHLVYGTMDPTPERVGRPDAYISRALSVVAKKNGRIVGALFSTEYPAKKVPVSLVGNPNTQGWGIHLHNTDRRTNAEKLLSGDVGGTLGRWDSEPSWIDPEENYWEIWEALANHAIRLFKERGAKFVQVEKRFSTESELRDFEASMNRLGLIASLKDHRIIMGTTL